MIRRLLPLWPLALVLLPVACASGTGTSGGTDAGVACASSKDCPSTYTCTQGVCAPKQTGGGCTAGTCPAHQFCGKDGSCVASGQQRCQSSSDCGGGFTCDPNTQLCVESCVTTADCASPEVCNNALGYCAECTFDTDCNDPTRLHCNQATGQCVACTVAGQCSAGNYCALAAGVSNPNTCQPGCLNDSDCDISTHCDRPGTDPGRCVQCTVTTEAQDCTSPGQPVCDPSTQLCVQCVRDGQCGTQVCDLSSNTCVDCLDDTTCNQGQVCDPSGHTCVAGCADAAHDNARCPPPGDTVNTKCDEGRGSFGQCVQCLGQPDCALGQICDPTGHCVAGCNGSATCPKSDPVCDLLANNGQGQCVQCRSDGDCPAPNLHCDTSASSPTYEQCLCLAQGASCTASGDCGNPPNHNWTCGPSWCVAEVQCPQGFVRMPTAECGDLCSDPAGGTGCTGGWVCRYVHNEQGIQGSRCTPANACN